MLENILSSIKSMLPKRILGMIRPPYHYLLALIGVLVYRFPSRQIKVVGITGTKGKTTTTELVAAILSEAGHTVALSNTYRFKIGTEEERNMHKMTMPGRFFVQRFLRRAVDAGCDFVVLEMTSEGVRQFRHKFIELDALLFTNLSPEHIESHGSFEKYRDAKRELGKLLEKSSKKNRVIVANADDKEGRWYLGLGAEKSVPFSLSHAEPFEKTESGYTFTFRGQLVNLKIPGKFNLYNALAAATFTASINTPTEKIKKALEEFTGVRGRVEFIQQKPFAVVVDYAHTIDSLEKFYGIFENAHNICVLGNTGGGRDSWKRPKMAAVAEQNCARIILTNEDPYDEDPQKILDEMSAGIQNKNILEVILDRRQAIAHAFEIASPGDNVLITGKGTDPYIMGPRGTKTPWDDARVAREELEKLSTRSTKKV